MKKLLGLLLVMTMAWPVSADVLKNVNLIGEIETIASDVHHNRGNDAATHYYNSGVNTRALVGLSAELVEDVTANILFQYTTNWNGNNLGDDLNTYQNRTELANANLVLSNLFDCFEATVGRQFYGDEDSAVIYFGPNHYNAENFNHAFSLDAAKVAYADDMKEFTVIAGKVRDLSNDGSNPDGTALYGADFKIALDEMAKVQVYGYDFRNMAMRNADGIWQNEENAGVYGGKLTLTPEMALLSVEYARNFGGDRLIKEGKDTGYMVKADAAVNIEAVTLRGAFLYGHENFIAWGNYTPGLIIGHKLGGAIYDYATDGVRLFNAGFDVKATETWTFALDGYAFQGRHGHHAATWEADLTAKYTHNEYVQLFAGLGYVKYGNDDVVPGLSYKQAFDKDNVKGQIGMLINF